MFRRRVVIIPWTTRRMLLVSRGMLSVLRLVALVLLVILTLTRCVSRRLVLVMLNTTVTMLRLSIFLFPRLSLLVVPVNLTRMLRLVIGCGMVVTDRNLLVAVRVLLDRVVLVLLRLVLFVFLVRRLLYGTCTRCLNTLNVLVLSWLMTLMSLLKLVMLLLLTRCRIMLCVVLLLLRIPCTRSLVFRLLTLFVLKLLNLACRPFDRKRVTPLLCLMRLIMSCRSLMMLLVTRLVLLRFCMLVGALTVCLRSLFVRRLFVRLFILLVRITMLLLLNVDSFVRFCV